MKVSIEFELDVESRTPMVDTWLAVVTKPMRLSRFLVPGSWEFKVDE